MTQPGVAPWTVGTAKIGTKKFKATFTLKDGGNAGTVELLSSGTDKYGGRQSSLISLPTLS
ncbi:hypothetical protein BH24CHL5_BH24CHL5_07590 [soil metagenome]